MKKKKIPRLIMFIAAAAYLFTGYGFSQDSPLPPGYALLTGVISAASDAGPDVTKTTNDLNQLMHKAKKAREEDEIDGAFFARYVRLLGAFRMALTLDDSEEILWPVFKKEIFPFIETSEGTVREEDLEAMYNEHGNVGLGGIIGAVMEEVVNLHIYLDTKEKRAEIVKIYRNVFMGSKK